MREIGVTEVLLKIKDIPPHLIVVELNPEARRWSLFPVGKWEWFCSADAETGPSKKISRIGRIPERLPVLSCFRKCSVRKYEY